MIACLVFKPFRYKFNQWQKALPINFIQTDTYHLVGNGETFPWLNHSQNIWCAIHPIPILKVSLDAVLLSKIFSHFSLLLKK